MIVSLSTNLKRLLWQRFGTLEYPVEWDGQVYGGGKISQRFWEYFITIELLEVASDSVVLDVGGGSPATGVGLFPRLLADAGIRVVVLDEKLGDTGGLPATLAVERGLADRTTLAAAFQRYRPTHVSCISVLEHATEDQQRGIFEAIEGSFNGVSAVFTLEFHETECHFEQQMTTATLSQAVSPLRRYYLDRVERSPVHCVNALSGKSRLWYPLALRFVRDDTISPAQEGIPANAGPAI